MKTKFISYSIAGECEIIDKEYFKVIDSREKAYWLGFLYADGNVYVRKDRPNTIRIQFKLKAEDKYMVENLKQAVNTDINVRDEVDGARLIFTCSDMARDLIRLGCVPNKAYIIKFPTDDIVPLEYKFDFIRGYFDGDGCFFKNPYSLYTIFSSASEDFVYGLKDFLKNYSISLSVPKRKVSDNTFNASVGSKESVNLLIKKMYENSNGLFLKRKFEYAYKYVNTEVKEDLKVFAYRNA